MDKPINNFKQIMDLVELYPNDQELGKNVRQVYWAQRNNVTDPNQLKINFICCFIYLNQYFIIMSCTLFKLFTHPARLAKSISLSAFLHSCFAVKKAFSFSAKLG